MIQEHHPDVDEGIFSALCSTIMGAAEAASGQLKTGLVGQISVKTEKGIIVLIPAGSKGNIYRTNRT